MPAQIPLDEALRADHADEDTDKTHEVAPDLAYLRLTAVNVALLGAPHSAEWVLIDTGLPGSAAKIRDAANSRFGDNARPKAIWMTHAHTDHAGSLQDLLEFWGDVPVHAHPLERPYLTGQAAYPPADPTVGGGLFTLMSPMLSREPVDVSRWLQDVPQDGSMPGFPEWRWVHTPGHTPGHISFFRQRDAAVLAGDAFITTRQESVYAIMTQSLEMHGPPQCFTPDWASSAESVRKLAALRPDLAICGHGRAVRGPGFLQALEQLARDFESIAVPKSGRYLDHPATAENGEAYVKPKG